MPFDWGAVASLWLGIFLGIVTGAWVAAAVWDAYVWRWLSHPSVRRMANAADRVTGKEGGIVGFFRDLLG